MYNKIILMGRLTADPVVSISDSGKKIATYNLAVNRPKSDDVDFFRCVGFGNNADFIEKNLTKGMKILVEGTARNERYTNKDGIEVTSFNVIVSDHRFCESKKSQSEFVSSDGSVFMGEELDG